MIIDVQRVKNGEDPALRFSTWYKGKELGIIVLVTPSLKPDKVAPLAVRALVKGIANVEGTLETGRWYDPEEWADTARVVAEQIRLALT